MKWIENTSYKYTHCVLYHYKCTLHISIALNLIVEKSWSVIKLRSSYIDFPVGLWLGHVLETKSAPFVLHRMSSSRKMWIFIAESWIRKSRSHPRRKMLRFRGSSVLPTVSCTSAWTTFRYLQGSPLVHLDYRLFLALLLLILLLVINCICLLFFLSCSLASRRWKLGAENPKWTAAEKSGGVGDWDGEDDGQLQQNEVGRAGNWHQNGPAQEREGSRQFTGDLHFCSGFPVF